MIKRINVKTIFILFLTLFLLFITLICGRGDSSARASAREYSSPLDDLTTDSSFNIEDYPENSEDYSISVIRIGESSSGELFVYTYQPCQVKHYIEATYINMSLSESVDGTKLYGLKLVKSSGVFLKYRVENISIDTADTRYYNISSIYRKFISGVDEKPDNDNIKSGVAFEVAQLWTVKTENKNVLYKKTITDVIEIADKYVDFLRYNKGIFWFMDEEYVDSHYVAFSTDMPIDKLYEVEIFYTSQVVRRAYAFSENNLVKETKDDPIDHYGVYSDKDQGDLVVDRPLGLFYAYNKPFSRIQSVDEFIKTESLSDNTKNNLLNKQWVLRFVETEYTDTNEQGFQFRIFTDISDVTILRLKFENDGEFYNFGTVDDMQRGDSTPGNYEDIGFFAYVWRCIVRLFRGTATVTEKMVAIIALIIVFIALPVLIIVLSLVFPAFGTVVKVVLKAIWKIITLPFKAIAALIRKIRSKKNGA